MYSVEKETLFQYHPQAVGLNFKDALMVLGMYPGASTAPGTDVAGTVLFAGPNTDILPGTRVVGFAPGALGSVVMAPAATCVPLPPSLTPHEGASLPTVCMTAQAALDIANVCDGDAVLVHALGGGLGMAAMQMLHNIGARVVGTASGGKRAILRGEGCETLLDSRSTAFAALAYDGVDAVLNSLTSPGMVAASLAACCVGGRYEDFVCVSNDNGQLCRNRFVEIGKRDIWSPQRMAQERPDVAYHLLAIDFWPQQCMGHALERVVRAAAQGRLTAMPMRSFGLHDAPRALRTLSQGRHMGT